MTRLCPYLSTVWAIWCCDGWAKTCCHINMSSWGDEWEPRIWQGGQQPRSTAQWPKGEHEMPISYDNPRHSCFLTLYALSNVHWSLWCFQRHDHLRVFSLFLTFFLPSLPSCWSIYLSYIDLFVLIQVDICSRLFVFLYLFFLLFQKDLCFSFASLLIPSLSLCIVTVMYTLIIFC